MMRIRVVAFATISVFLLAASPAAVSPEVALPTPDEAVAQLRQCGFAEVSTHYQDDLQDNVIEIADASATDEQLECAADVYLASGYWTELSETLRPKYFADYERVSAQWAKQRALSELQQSGELGRLPVYEKGRTNDADFADRLESLCGPRAKGMLHSQYGPHSVSPQWASGIGDFAEDGKALQCVSRFAAAAEFKLYFIGNEKTASPSSAK